MQNLLDGIFRRHFQILFFGAEDGDHLIGVRYKCLHHHVQRFYGDARSYLADDAIFVFDARYGLVIKEVTYIFIDVFIVLAFITFVVGRFQIAQILGAGALVFAFGETEPAGTFHFAK